MRVLLERVEEFSVKGFEEGRCSNKCFKPSLRSYSFPSSSICSDVATLEYLSNWQAFWKSRSFQSCIQTKHEYFATLHMALFVLTLRENYSSQRSGTNEFLVTYCETCRTVRRNIVRGCNMLELLTRGHRHVSVKTFRINRGPRSFRETG